MRNIRWGLCGAAICAVSLSGWAFAGPAPGARLILDCNVQATTMTLTLSAKTKGGGKPQPISLAGPAIVMVDQKDGHQWAAISGYNINLGTVNLPLSHTFELCPNGTPAYNTAGGSIRGRTAVFVPDVGFVSSHCSPTAPPSC